MAHSFQSCNRRRVGSLTPTMAGSSSSWRQVRRRRSERNENSRERSSRRQMCRRSLLESTRNPEMHAQGIRSRTCTNEEHPDIILWGCSLYTEFQLREKRRMRPAHVRAPNGGSGGGLGVGGGAGLGGGAKKPATLKTVSEGSGRETHGLCHSARTRHREVHLHGAGWWTDSSAAGLTRSSEARVHADVANKGGRRRSVR